MSIFVYLGLCVTGLCIGVGLWAAWLSRLERWHGLETVAICALGAAGYEAMESLSMLPELRGGADWVLLCQTAFAGVFVSGFLARRAIRDRRPLTRDEQLSLALAFLVSVLYWVPGVSMHGVTTREVWGFVLPTMDATPVARVQSGLMTVLMARGFYQVGQDSRSGVESLRGMQLAGYLLVVAAVCDQLAVMQVWEFPETIGLALVVFVLGTVRDVVARIERSDGEVLRLQQALRELAEQRGADLLEARQDLQQQTRFTVLGELASGIAHEINNPASTVVNNLTYLLEVEDFQGDSLEAAQDARREAGRISRLVKRLVRSTQVGEAVRAELRPLKLRAHVLNAVRAVEERHTGVFIATDVSDRLLVRGDAEALELVLTSVLLTSVHHAVVPGHPSPLVEVLAEGLGDDGVRVVITDNGVALGEGKVMSPFDSSADQSNPGLGLSVSYGLLRSMGGELEVRSAAGRGSVAVITLPRGVERAPFAERATVLLIDDEAAVRDALRRSLARRHRVVAAGSVAEGLAQLEAGVVPDLVLCDVMMPGVNGDEFYRELERQYPELVGRLVFMSGGVSGEARAFMATWKGTLLQKPFGINDVQEILDARGGAETSEAPD